MKRSNPIYFSASTRQFFEDPTMFGCMFSYRSLGAQWEALRAGCLWMLDNGAFTNKFRFRAWVWLLARFLPWRSSCVGIIIPDIPYDAAATRQRFLQYYAIPQVLGYPIAHATQDGMTPEDLPWQLFDVVFIGGSDSHKRGIEATRIAHAAKRYDKWIHIGRVSGGRAIRTFWSWADSYDGSTFVRNGKRWGAADKKRTIGKALRDVRGYAQWGML